jgi:hypothetical protein
MVELRTTKRVIRGYRGNHPQKLGVKRISCASQFTIPDTAGMSPDPACYTTHTWTSQPNQASCTPDFSYPLIITLFSSSSPISHILVRNSTIIAEHNVKSSLSISPCHDHELTPSTAFTEYSIHRVQHTSKIVCLPFVLMITSWPPNVARASTVPPYTIDRHWPARHHRSRVKSPCHIPTVVCVITDEYDLSTQRAVHRLPLSTHPNSLHHGLQVYLQTRSITASKCMYTLAWSRHPSASPNSLDHGLQVHLHTHLSTVSKCISKLARSLRSSVYLNSPDYGIQVRSITACISSPISLDHGLGVYLWVNSIFIFRRTSNCSQAPPAASPDILCVDG